MTLLYIVFMLDEMEKREVSEKEVGERYQTSIV